jgi:hypothetical protein
MLGLVAAVLGTLVESLYVRVARLHFYGLAGSAGAAVDRVVVGAGDALGAK